VSDPAALGAVGLAALDNFIGTFNSRNADAWAASLSYPHVRVSPRQAVAAVTPDERSYAAATNYHAADAMGWDHSEWDAKTVLAVSDTKIHASAQWCRFNAAGERILVNNVSYVITDVGGRWGIQARFGVDSPPPADPSGAIGRAEGAWERVLAAAGDGSTAAATELVRLPFNIIEVGDIKVASNLEDVLAYLGNLAAGTGPQETVALQAGDMGVNLGVTLTGSGGSRRHALVLVVLDEEGARVSAASVIDDAHLVSTRTS